ncbi:hypothetical protein LCGC14_0452640 [marine sediment metagenome]|uniref:OmpA-like domain-containing protein n=1 Tax=marine sediment metagenome TaxID=412755 RepID=A0A0F9VRD5_9ZZZZ
MTRQGQGGLILLVAISAFGAIGCNPNAREIQTLKLHKQALQRENTKLAAQLKDALDEQDTLLRELEDKDAELAQAAEQWQDAEDRAKAAEAIAAGIGGAPTGPTADGWTATPAGDKITVGSNILFSPGRAKLTDAGKRALNGIARDLTVTYSGRPVRVYGFTDGDPIRKTKKLWQDNLDLSANRAMAVTRHLIGQGVDTERLETIAMGPARPVASNSSAAGKARNRRVEIYAIR